MTEHTRNHTSDRGVAELGFPSAHTVTTGLGSVPLPGSVPGSEHVWVRMPHRSSSAFALWRWSPRGLAQRGRTASRDDERAYHDLQAVRDRAQEA